MHDTPPDPANPDPSRDPVLGAPSAVDRGLERLRRLVEDDPALAAELAASASEFFRAPLPADPEERDRARRRHLEWFLFERPSTALGGRPVDDLLETLLRDAEPALTEHAEAFRDSLASIFTVTGLAAGEGAWLQDLAGFGAYPVREPHASQVLAEGDLIVGRLFPAGEGAFHVSRAAGVFRDAKLLEALQRDLDRAREGRRGVLRLAQSELEAMFWSLPTQVARERAEEPARAAGEDPVAAARAALARGGLDPAQVEALLAELGAAPFRPERWVHGARDALGEMLDRLAFETEVDLDEARRALLAAWPLLADEATPPAAKPGVPAAQAELDAALRDYERGLRAGADKRGLLADLEERLALDAEDDEAEQPLPDFPGVVGAMVEEFVWEAGLEDGRDAEQELGRLRSLGRYGAEIGVFENLGARDLLAYTCLWLPESGELDGPEDARALVGALDEFCRWAEANHDVPLRASFGEVLDRLADSLPRIAAANRARSDAERGQAGGELFVCVDVDEGAGEARLRSPGGDERTWSLGARLVRHLRPDDRMRASVQAEGLRVHCCYPPELAELTSR